MIEVSPIALDRNGTRLAIGDRVQAVAWNGQVQDEIYLVVQVVDGETVSVRDSWGARMSRRSHDLKKVV